MTNPETEIETEAKMSVKWSATIVRWTLTLHGIEHSSDSRLFFGVINDECMSFTVQRTALSGGIGPVQVASHHFVAAVYGFHVREVLRTSCTADITHIFE